ncbi:hypothetical protein [Alistipes onderdonkii]|uniref:hypothetical protein n=1 Tax=Alistipes onderdonkii TaxID=328813 RepID=UPI0034A08924
MTYVVEGFRSSTRMSPVCAMASPSRSISSAVGRVSPSVFSRQTYAAVSGSVRAALNVRVVVVVAPAFRTTEGRTFGAVVECSMVLTLPLSLPFDATAERR